MYPLDELFAPYLDFTAPDLAPLEALYLERPRCYHKLALNPTLSAAGARRVATHIAGVPIDEVARQALGRIPQRGRDLEAALSSIDDPLYWASLVHHTNPGTRDLTLIVERRLDEGVALAALGVVSVRRTAVRAGLGGALLGALRSPLRRLPQWASLVEDVAVDVETAVAWVEELIDLYRSDRSTSHAPHSLVVDLALATVLYERADLVARLGSSPLADDPYLAQLLAGGRHLSEPLARRLAGRPAYDDRTSPVLGTLLSNPHCPTRVLEDLLVDLRHATPADDSPSLLEELVSYRVGRFPEAVSPGDATDATVRRVVDLSRYTTGYSYHDALGTLVTLKRLARERSLSAQSRRAIAAERRRLSERYRRRGRVLHLDGAAQARAYGPDFGGLDREVPRVAWLHANDRLARASLAEWGLHDVALRDAVTRVHSARDCVALARVLGVDPVTHRRMLALAPDWRGTVGELAETLRCVAGEILAPVVVG